MHFNQIFSYIKTTLGIIPCPLSLNLKREIVMCIFGPDRLELIIFDIIGKKFYNHPSRLQL